jgi:hypothetical protein
MTCPHCGKPVEQDRAIGFTEVCRRLDISPRQGERLISEGRFPIPELPRQGQRRHRFSTRLLDEYLRDGSLAAVLKRKKAS